MSEYQYVEFRAVDRSLTEEELEFAENQSTRAVISCWSFQNEYHFGDFRGDVNGLLRRGYDVHLHYANFGVRTAAFRLPAELPFPKRVWSQYIGVGELRWEKDRNGKAGILSISPFHEPGEIEEIWNPGEYMDDIVEVRSWLVAGDLGALYELWLCAATDDQSVEPDVVEPAVPGGLSQCADAFGPFMEFFGLDPLILIAAAEGSPDAPKQPPRDQHCREWVELNDSESRLLLRRFLTEDANAVKAEMIAAIRHLGGSSDWPTVSLGRSLQMLLDRTEQIRADLVAKEQKKREAAARRETAAKERQRQDWMKEMVKELQTWLRGATKLVDARGTANYKAAAEILADLREAVGGDDGENITRKHAAHLTQKHPTLTHLKSSLRKRGLLE